MCSSLYYILTFTVIDLHRGLSLSTTLVSRSMLRLRSDFAQRDLRVTEQNTDVFFVPTLSGLSGELPSTPIAMTEYGEEEYPELKRNRERC